MEAKETSGPTNRRLGLLSVAVFTGLVVVGGVVGWLVGVGNAEDGVGVAQGDLATVDLSEEDRADLAERALAIVEREQTPPDLSVERDAAPVTVPAEVSDEQPPLARQSDVEDANVEVTSVEDAELQVEVLAVTELNLELPLPPTSAVRQAQGVEFVELPKAVYDTFVLEAGEVLAINVAANDKVGGQLDAVRPTELGELPPGFTLETNGVLSGKSNECGRWRQQYALVSDNPFVGTSWIDITIDGCGQTG